MKFAKPLVKAKIIKRYKRFLSDLELESGEMIHAHVPNTGSMKTCWQEGWYAWVSESENPKRKLKYTWELTDNDKTLICVNTNLPNRIIKEALVAGEISELASYKTVQAEKKVFDSRIDFFLQQENCPDAFVEVKNVTLRSDDGLAIFPDSVSLRGQKHLIDLMKLKKQGKRAVMLYLINRGDVRHFEPAREIDPIYTKLLQEAEKMGVEILAYQTEISTTQIKLKHKVEYKL